MAPPENERDRWPDAEPPTVRAFERELRTPASAGAAGIVFSVLFMVSMILLRRSNAGLLQEVGSSRRAGDTALVLAGLYLTPFAGIAFLWFMAAVRDRIGAHEDRFFATVFLGSGLLFVAMLFAGSATAGSLVAGHRFMALPRPSPELIAFDRALAYTLFLVYAVKTAGVFMVVSSTIVLKLATMPRWLALSGYLIAAVLLFSVTYVELVFALFPLWVSVVSVFILLTARRTAP